MSKDEYRAEELLSLLKEAQKRDRRLAAALDPEGQAIRLGGDWIPLSAILTPRRGDTR